MSLQEILKQKEMSKYKLSQLSGIPKTTILDICAGRSEISRCSAGTVQRLAKALGCTMEAILEDTVDNGCPEESSYMECGLPNWLEESIAAMKEAWRKLDAGEEYFRWDCDFCNLQTDINNAEVNGIISTEQAWHLRTKYLRIERA